MGLAMFVPAPPSRDLGGQFPLRQLQGAGGGLGPCGPFPCPTRYSPELPFEVYAEELLDDTDVNLCMVGCEVSG